MPDLDQKTLPSTTKDEPKQKKERTRAENNQLALRSLTGLAILCVVLSAGVLFFHETDAKEILQATFAPVGIIVAGLLGFIKS